VESEQTRPLRGPSKASTTFEMRCSDRRRNMAGLKRMRRYMYKEADKKNEHHQHEQRPNKLPSC